MLKMFDFIDDIDVYGCVPDLMELAMMNESFNMLPYRLYITLDLLEVCAKRLLKKQTQKTKPKSNVK